MTAVLKRTLLRLEDWARTHDLSVLTNVVALLLAVALRRAALHGAIARFQAAGSGLRRYRWLSRVAMKAAARDQLVAMRREPVEMRYSIIAKAPQSARERGVLLVSFEDQLAALTASPHFSEIERSYQVCFLPTWQPSYSRELYELAARSSLPYVVMPAWEPDMQLAVELGPLCVTMPFHSASWIPGEQFDGHLAKDIDIILLANFSRYKRHWRLFEALSQMDGEYRVVCAGRPWGGRDKSVVESEARAFGVGGKIEYMENPSNQEVSALLARSRLFCAMSHKEGAFVAVAESLVANTPVGMFEDATIGTKSYINNETGFLFSANIPLGPQIEAALVKCPQLRPREWACREITSRHSVRRFNELLQKQSVDSNHPWTRDVADIYCRNFSFSYSNPVDVAELRASHMEFKQRWNIELTVPNVM